LMLGCLCQVLQNDVLLFLPKLEELPESFEFTTPFPVKDQKQTDYCSAYAACGASELQEEVELYPEYSFALSKELSGNPDAWGQTLRHAQKAHQKYGAVEANLALELAQNIDLRRLESYPREWLKKAIKHKKKSYFKISGRYDHFDNIRASIWKYREEKRAIEIGLIFGWPLPQYKLDTVQQQGFGHAMYVTGWANDDTLIVVNSYGLSAGQNGKHKISREVINAFIGRFGAYMFLDLDPKDVKTQIERRELYFATRWERVIIYVVRVFKSLWK